MKVAVNGFGRIGRIFTRIALEQNEFEIVAINDLASVSTLAHLFKYDSVHGRFNGTVETTESELILNGKAIKVYSEPNPENLNWTGIDLLLEASGRFRKLEEAQLHIHAGARRVLLSAPPKSPEIGQYVMGLNHTQLTNNELIFSNASCTTNSCAHIVKLIDDSWGIENGFLTTVHAYTSDQRIHDAPHSDLRRARAAANSIIPTSTGAAKAIIKLFPHLEGRFQGNAARVPVLDGSFTDLTLLLRNPASVEEINACIKLATENELNGIVEYTTEPLVSTDIIGNNHSGVFDSSLTESFGKLVKLITWYDNEFGYSARLVDLVKYYLTNVLK
ncbi:MAG: type I glyceraldehyde-3-phosphate dehydrogenase [Bacteroidetes bacterium]|nr:type I glyceraldehyde-3-phosphate dehydrogenase [Bacteroidota bacterium]